VRARRGASVSREDGAGTVLAIGLVAALVAALLLAAAAAVLLDAHRRVSAAADAAALAGADIALGNATGLPCVGAERLVRTGGLRLGACEQRGALVRVSVSTVVLGVRIGAEALAGPPPTR
jgi:secretion/DNA translocation related TadE-like protein